MTGTSDPTECGKNGNTCNVCTGLTTGTACVLGACGCAIAATDCPCTSGVDEKCTCTGSNVCVDTTIVSFTASVTGGNASTSTLSWSTTGATTCSIFDGTTTTTLASCNGGPQSFVPVGTTTYTLTATGPGGSATAQVTISCNAISNPSQAGNTCPSGATQFCETSAITSTSSGQAADACNVCNSPLGACTLDSGDSQLGNANAWVPPNPDAGVAQVFYVFSAASADSSLCSNTYEPAAGDIITLSSNTCPEGHWAP